VKGYLWCSASLLLVTAAQLLMKWGMMQIPPFSLAEVSFNFVMSQGCALLAVCSGIMGYAVSMLCWFFALRSLPLNRAYTLLSLSYALVYIAAICLPAFHESQHWLKSLGALCILLGVSLVHSKSPRADD
jgi:undecaprenyl phosphate-alpha-L-ara4N flippase subunit ArnF